MTTTATAPRITREMLDDRWRMATTKTVLSDDGPPLPSDTNNKVIVRLTGALHTLAGRMIEDWIKGDEEAAWETFHNDLMHTIEEKIKDFGYQIETARRVTRKPVAS